MPYWIPAKTDWTLDDFENIEDFNRQKHNVEYISTYVMPLLNMHPAFIPINDVDLTTYHMVTLLNTLEANITEIGKALSAAYPKAQLTLQQVPISGKFASGQVFRLPARISLLGDWKNGETWAAGENESAPDYTDANRWENNMVLIRDWAKKQPAVISFKPSGTFAAGQINLLPRSVI